MKTIANTGRRRLLLPLLVLGLLQASCTLLPEEKPLRMFMLSMQSTQPSTANTAPFPLELRIRTLQANHMLANSRIAVVPDENEITIYGGVRWTDPAPILLRDRLLEAFQSGGHLQAVYSEDNRLQPDVELSGTLRAFQSEYIGGRQQVRIQVDLHITDSAGRQLLASRRFEVSEASGGSNIEQVVASFGRAGDVLSEQVVEWTLSVIGKSLD